MGTTGKEERKKKKMLTRTKKLLRIRRQGKERRDVRRKGMKEMEEKKDTDRRARSESLQSLVI